MAEISRQKVTTEQVEVPEGFVVCPHCDGRGMLSAYDRGARSVVFSPRLAALESCIRCKGLGYVPLRNDKS